MNYTVCIGFDRVFVMVAAKNEFFCPLLVGKLLESTKSQLREIILCGLLQWCLLVNATHVTRRGLWLNVRCNDVTWHVLAKMCGISMVILKSCNLLRILLYFAFRIAKYKNKLLSSYESHAMLQPWHLKYNKHKFYSTTTTVSVNPALFLKIVSPYRFSDNAIKWKEETKRKISAR